MEKLKTTLGAFAGTVVIGGLLLSEPMLRAQDASQGSSAQGAQASQDQEQSRTFMGTVGKAHGALVLKGGYASQSPNAKTTYKLDDQEKAKQYVGKNVKVTGALDASTNTIHVSEIEPAS